MFFTQHKNEAIFKNPSLPIDKYNNYPLKAFIDSINGIIRNKYSFDYLFYLTIIII